MHGCVIKKTRAAYKNDSHATTACMVIEIIAPQYMLLHLDGKSIDMQTD